MAEKTTPALGYREWKQDMDSGIIAPLYIFHGEERYLLEHAVREMEKQLIPDVFAAFNSHRLSGKNLRVQELVETAEALPMGAERTLLIVTDFDLYKLPEEERSAFIAMLEDFPDYCCMILIYDLVEYKPNKTYRKLYAAIEKYVRVICFDAQERRGLLAWIARRFRSLGHEISAQTAEYLIFICGSLMTGLVPEIEKIGAYATGEYITPADIDAVAEPILDAVVFDMTNAITRGDYDHAADVLGKLLKKQEEPIMLLAVIGRELRRIYTARIALESGRGKSWLMEIWNMRSDYPARLLLDAAKTRDLHWCRESLILCRELDLRMKSETGIDSAGELVLLLMRLAQGEVKR